MANVTITTTDKLIGEVWGTPVLMALEKNVVLAPLLDRRYEAFPRDGGDTVHVPNIASYTARTLTNMTGAVTFDSNTDTETNIVVNTLAYHAIKVDSAAKVQESYPLLSLYTEKQGIALAIKVDTDCGADINSGVTQNEGTDNVDVTDDDVLSAIKQLNVANADPAERVFAFSPKTYESFMRVDKWINSLYAALGENQDGTKGRGFAGKRYDFDMYTSTNLPAGSAGTVNLMFQRECEALIMQKDISVRNTLPHDEIAESIIVWTMYGLKTLRATAGVKVYGK